MVGLKKKSEVCEIHSTPYQGMLEGPQVNAPPILQRILFGITSTLPEKRAKLAREVSKQMKQLWLNFGVRQKNRFQNLFHIQSTLTPPLTVLQGSCSENGPYTCQDLPR